MSIISVIVPVYKVEPYLRRCVDSILGQTFADFELILVDDGSPDHCPAICDEYAQKDSRVHVIHQENGGLSAARNAGIDWAFANSDSQWLSFVDSDDWIHPMYLEALIAAVKGTNTTVSIGAYQETEGKEPAVDEHHLTAIKWNAEDIYVEKNIYATIACGKLYEKKHFNQIRYPAGKIHEDEFVTYRILFEAGKVSFVDEPLYAYFMNNSGITKSQWNPQRLSSVEATKQQVQYMKQNGYNKGFQRAIRKYVLNLATQIIQLKTCDASMQNYIPQLRSTLKRALIRHKKIVPFSEYKWVYELAFPRMMSLYWMINAQIDKIIRKE